MTRKRARNGYKKIEIQIQIEIERGDGPSDAGSDCPVMQEVITHHLPLDNSCARNRPMPQRHVQLQAAC